MPQSHVGQENRLQNQHPQQVNLLEDRDAFQQTATQN